MRRLVVLVMAVGMLFAAVPAVAAADSPYCGIYWGSRAKSSTAHPDSPIATARAGQHTCFDRFVVEVDGEAPGYRVEYVTDFAPDASGRTVDLRGGATLAVTLLGARAHDAQGRTVFQPARRSEMVTVDGFRTFRQVYWGGTFEATSTVGVGVRARLPFRVFTLAGPGDHTRLVIDVAHRW